MSVVTKLLFLAFLPGGPAVNAAEFEVLDKLTVDGYSLLIGSADIRSDSFTVGGSSFVVKDGNVGIGTTGPAYPLDVNGRFRVGTGILNNLFFVDTTNGNISVGAGGNARYLFNIGGAGDLAWTSAGGTGANDIAALNVRPSYIANISGTGDISSALISAVSLNPTGTSSIGASLRVGAPVEGGAGSFAAMASIYIEGAPTGGTSGNGALLIASGNVGIGTENPGGLLELYGSANQLVFNFGDTTPWKIVRQGTANNQHLRFQMGSTDHIELQPDGDVILAPTSGNVGLGTTGPGTKLDVAGTVNATNFTKDGVTVTGVPSGMVAFFPGACPTGWNEYIAADGRAIVAIVGSKTNAATVGTALGNTANRTIADVPAHVHSVGPISTVSGNQNADHTHSGTTNSATTGISAYDWANWQGGLISASGQDDAIRPSNGRSNSAYFDIGITDPGHTHGFATGGVNANHAHSIDITAFNSGSTGSASVDVTMPYIQLRCCQAP